jgi:hypothetical protein
VSFAAITLCVASQRVFIVVYFVIDSVRKLMDTPSYNGALLPKALRNGTVLIRIGFRTICTSRILIKVKIDVDSGVKFRFREQCVIFTMQNETNTPAGMGSAYDAWKQK